MSKLDDIRRLREQKFGGLAEERLGPKEKQPVSAAGAVAMRMPVGGGGAPHPPPKRGRPLAKDADKTLSATKPWEALKLSRRTWYRRTTGK